MNKIYKSASSALLLLLLVTTGNTHLPRLTGLGVSTDHDLSFIENRGQWEPEIRYKAEIPGGAVFITDYGFVYNFSSETDRARIHELTCGRIEAELSEEDVSREIIKYHAYKVNFIGANKPEAYFTEGKRDYHHNYW